MVSSGEGRFGDGNFDRFEKWFAGLPRTIHPRDYLTDGKSGGYCWLYMYEDGMDTAGFEVADFRGGLYAVATDIDQKTNVKAMDRAVNKFLKANGFVRDNSRKQLGNIITPPEAQKVMGYNHMDYYTPVKVR